MPVESPPERGALWLTNRILSASIASVSDQHVNFPASRLLNPQPGDSYQSNGIGSDTVVVFDFGAPIIPVGLALIGSNFTAGSIRFRGSDDAAQVTNPVYFDLPIYTQDPIGKELKWYPGTPTSGTMGSGRRFWSPRILPSVFGSYGTAEDYYEIGAVMIITEYLALRPWEGFKPRPRNPSTRTYAKNRAKWSEPMPTLPYGHRRARRPDAGGVGGHRIADPGAGREVRAARRLRILVRRRPKAPRLPLRLLW